DGAQDRAQDRAEAADDDHGEVVDGDDDLERLVVGDAEIVGVEHAAHARVERGDREGEQLVAEDVDAYDLGSDVLIANGDEGAADAAAHQVHGRHDGEHGEEQQEEVEVTLGLELVAPDRRARHLDGRLGAAGDGGRVVDHPFDDELARQRGNGEIEALDPEARDADQRADEGGHQPAGGKRDPERQMQVGGEVGGRVRTHGHEGGMPHRDLAGIADQNVEPQRTDDGDQHE